MRKTRTEAETQDMIQKESLQNGCIVAEEVTWFPLVVQCFKGISAAILIAPDSAL